jgi:hypothetical protein
MRTTRKLVLLALIAALLAAPSSTARAAGASRSGTIVSGVGWSPASVWVRGMEGCVGAPSCSAWLQSACSPALAGKSPAVDASIVGVASFADGRSLRTLRLEGVVGINWGQVIIQFWRATPLDCGEMLESRLTCSVYYGFCSFRIPSGARWTTITATPDNTLVDWTLR